jgi:hypothetical protein
MICCVVVSRELGDGELAFGCGWSGIANGDRAEVCVTAEGRLLDHGFE